MLSHPILAGVVLGPRSGLCVADSFHSAIGEVTPRYHESLYGNDRCFFPVTAGAVGLVGHSDGQSTSDVELYLHRERDGDYLQLSRRERGRGGGNRQERCGHVFGPDARQGRHRLHECGDEQCAAVLRPRSATGSFAVVPGTPTQLIVTSPPPGSVAAGGAGRFDRRARRSIRQCHNQLQRVRDRPTGE